MLRSQGWAARYCSGFGQGMCGLPVRGYERYESCMSGGLQPCTCAREGRVPRQVSIEDHGAS